jgi:DNA-binding IclR family transcriptional regulator
VKDGIIEVLSRVETGRDFKISVNPGARFPAHAGAASKVLLAFLPEADRRGFITPPLEKFTETTVTDPALLLKTLQEIRESCVGYDREEFMEGIAAIACPVFNFLGEIVAALSVPFIASAKHISFASLEEKKEKILETARHITRELGGEYPV